MAAYDLEEQEQLAELKAWWSKYSGMISAVVTVLAVAVLSWQAWNWWQGNQAKQASVLYGELNTAVSAKDAKKAREVAGELLSKFGSTTQADLGALLASRAELDAGDTKGAASKLEWASTKANDPLFRDLARVRLAAIQLDAKEYDTALKTIEAAPAKQFEARFADMRGDIYFGKGDLAAAGTAYAKAAELLTGEEGSAQYLSFVELKIEALGDS